MKKKAKIAFIPKTEYVPAYCPKPELMSKNLPIWWREQSAYVNGKKEINNGQFNETVKKCPGIFDLLTSGYLLKTPCDVHIDATGDKIVAKYNDTHNLSFGLNTSEQISYLDYDRNIFMDDAFRINPMWVVKTPPGYSTLFLHPSFQDGLPFRTVSAIIDTDKYVSDGPYSLLVRRGFVGMIDQGTPLVQCIPFKREEFNMEILQNPDLTVFGPLNYIIRAKFSGSYKKFLHSKKVYK